LDEGLFSRAVFEAGFAHALRALFWASILPLLDARAIPLPSGLPFYRSSALCFAAYCLSRYFRLILPPMLDRSQHLRLFLVGSGCSREDADRISVDKCVQVVLNQQPVDAQWLLEAINRASQFTLSREKEPEFLALFGRYSSAARAGSRLR
jgi:hypothetical protein